MTEQRKIEEITLIPSDMLKIIPLFGGDKRQLNLFIHKSEYIISKFRGSDAQNLYVYHCITSRLINDAAALLSEREDVMTWSELKALLIQHFGDPRSEQCIAIELEMFKIRHNESYLDFCKRIQTARSILISKVNRLGDEDIKRSKIDIYNNTALNVFLYNLPEHLVRIVRLRKPATLEEALSIVLEEVDFHEQHSLRNKLYNHSVPKLHNPVQPQSSFPSFKFGIPNTQTPLKFNYGNPQSRLVTQNRPQNSYFGFRSQVSPPQFGYRPPQVGYRPQQVGYRPPQFLQSQTRMQPHQFMQPQHFQPQQYGYRPQLAGVNQNFGYRPQLSNQSHKLNNENTDVSMRTAPLAKPPQGFRLNELSLTEHEPEYYEYYNGLEQEQPYYNVDPYYYTDTTNYPAEYEQGIYENATDLHFDSSYTPDQVLSQDPIDPENNENFCITSPIKKPK